MKAFFNVLDIETVHRFSEQFAPVAVERVPLHDAFSRILAADLTADQDLPPFSRSTMDGYAVAAAATFGASEASPALLTIVGTVSMGSCPEFRVAPGEAAR